MDGTRDIPLTHPFIPSMAECGVAHTGAHARHSAIIRQVSCGQAAFHRVVSGFPVELGGTFHLNSEPGTRTQFEWCVPLN